DRLDERLTVWDARQAIPRRDPAADPLCLERGANGVGDRLVLGRIADEQVVGHLTPPVGVLAAVDFSIIGPILESLRPRNFRSPSRWRRAIGRTERLRSNTESTERGRSGATGAGPRRRATEEKR